jgi:hypothetical protein
LTDEIGTELIEGQEADDEQCKQDEEEEEEGAMQEAMQKIRFSKQDTSGIEDINDCLSEIMPTQMSRCKYRKR